MGVFTTDFKAFHELIEVLRDMRMPFFSMAEPRDVPPHVGVVITTGDCADRVDFGPKVVIDGSVKKAARKALQTLHGEAPYSQLIVGIDPGEMPGLAVLGDGSLLETMRARSPEEAAALALEAVDDYDASRKVVRVGHGDEPNRDRTLKSLERWDGTVEVVDETGTTPMPGTTDMESAASIARARGYRIHSPPNCEPKPGKVRDVQRKSRVESGGTLTLSRGEAEAVAKGEITMEAAIRKKKEER
ncbi:MAG: hypothetical protein HZB92_07365 [Euryarchaeota archaeon]|nr:hypothetical protein [Euryarchaeota archaeon]